MINKIKKNNRIIRAFKLIYLKIFRIHDTPQRIALGFGLGVFLGIIPGTGPIAALALAFVLRVNRASALLGSLLTNTWLSIVTFFLSIKIGSTIMHLDWQVVYQEWLQFLRDFRFLDLFKFSALKIILPLITGYFIIAFCLGAVAYLIIAILVRQIKTKGRNEDKGRINFSR